MVKALASAALLILTLMAGVTVGWAVSREAPPVVPITAPVLNPASEWPAGFYVRFDGEFRFYMLAQPED